MDEQAQLLRDYFAAQLREALQQHKSQRPSFLQSQAFSQIIHSSGSLQNATPISVLVLKISGRYRDGSLGFPDALKIIEATTDEMKRHDPQGVIFDFTDLGYEWGDDLAKALIHPRVVGNPKMPITTIVSHRCNKALESLRPFYAYHMLSLSNDVWIHTTLKDALTYIQKSLIKQEFNI